MRAGAEKRRPLSFQGLATNLHLSTQFPDECKKVLIDAVSPLTTPGNTPAMASVPVRRSLISSVLELAGTRFGGFSTAAARSYSLRCL